jgi:diamine N-acetyltransferase
MDKLKLLPLLSTDSDFLMDLYNNETIYDFGFLDYTYPHSDIEIKNRIERWLKLVDQKHFIMEYDNVTIGIAQIFNISLISRKCNIGILIKPDYTGKGIGTLVLKLIINICFNKINLRKIEVSVAQKNTPSIRMIERLGFAKEGTLKESLFHSGEYIDIHLYGLINKKCEISSRN